MLKPVLQMFGVEADAHSAPRGVNQPCGGIFQSQALEGRQAWVLGQGLGVVRHSSGHGVSDHHDELGAAVHCADPTRSLLRDKVAGRFLHGDLAVQRPRHQLPDRHKEREQNSDLSLTETLSHLQQCCSLQPLKASNLC